MRSDWDKTEDELKYQREADEARLRATIRRLREKMLAICEICAEADVPAWQKLQNIAAMASSALSG